MAAISGSSGNDIFDISVGNIAQLLEGDDTFIGSEGTETVNAGTGDDVVFGRGGNDILVGEEGDDELNGESGNDTLDGGQGSDRGFGGEGNDYISGGADDDLLLGEDGNDQLRGNAGDDAISGGLGNDTLAGEEGDDQILGDTGDDVLNGGKGNDTIVGAENNDFLSGEEGDDVLNGGIGSDNLDGGNGNDLLVGDKDDAPTPIDLGTEVPLPELEASLSELFGNDAIRGGDGNDTGVGGAGSDFISGDDGNDLIYGNQGNDFIVGGDGRDTVHGGQNNDQIYGNTGNDLLYGDNGNDKVFGGKGNDSIYGNKGADELNGNLGNDTIYGGQDNDIVRGGNGNDRLFGDLGDDTIYGDVGADTVTGGQGRDVFSIARGRGGTTVDLADIITDFQNGQDLIEISAPLAFENLTISQGTGNNANNTLVQDKLTGEFLLVLQNVNVSLIDRDDFIPGLEAPPPVIVETPTEEPPADAGTLELTQATYQYNESGTAVGVAVSVRRTGGSDGTAGATITFTNGTATAPADYTNTAIPVNFADGEEGAKTVVIPLIDDKLAEAAEKFTVNLTAPTSGVTLGEQTTATLEILDNDNPGAIDFSAPTFTGSEVSGTAQITVKRTGGSDGDVTATITLTNGTATGGAPPFPTTGTVDYNNTVSTTVTFKSGDTQDKIINIPINNDTDTEGTETVSLALTGANVGKTQPTATLNIEDDDVPIVGIDADNSDLEASEEQSSTGLVVVTNSGTSPVTVRYKLEGTAATDASDYTITSSNPADTPGQVTVAANGTATLTVTPIDDVISEGNETVKVTLDPLGGLYSVDPARASAEVTILDNEVPIVEITATDASAAEQGLATGTYTVRRKDGAGNPVTIGGALNVNYSMGGSATSGSDYNPLSGVVTIPDGSDSATFTLTPVDDATPEFDESVIASLVESTTYSIDTAREEATVSIDDNEPTKVIIRPIDADAAEAGLDPGLFLIQRLGDKSQAITVNFAVDTATSTAAEGVDFQQINKTVTIAAGQRNANVVITPINDTGSEPEPAFDTVILNLIEPTDPVAAGYSLGSPTSSTVFIQNNGT